MFYTPEQMIALFSAAPPPGYVRRKGKVFECGDYPDKNFKLTQAEADFAIANFIPKAADVEHIPTLLDGHMGIMRGMSREGDIIFAEADVPTWLDKILETVEPAVSMAWDRTTKLLNGWGWVLDPRIADAKLLTSSFANFKNQQEAAQVNSQLPTRPVTKPIKPTREKKRMSLLTAINAGLARFSATAQVPAPVPAPQPAPAPTPSPVPAPAPNPAPAPQPGASFSAPGVETAEETALATFRANQINTRSEEIANALVAEGVLHSSGKNLAVATFSMLGFDNEESGPTAVTFSKIDGTISGDRVAMVRELFKHVPHHALFSQSMPVFVHNATASTDGDEDSPEKQGAAQAARFNKEMGAGLPKEAATVHI